MPPDPSAKEFPAPPPSIVGDAIVSATETLFMEIAREGGPGLSEAMSILNSRRRLLRIHEAALILDREAELAAIRAAWKSRDMAGLKALIVEYYRRRQALAPRLSALMNTALPRQ